MKIKHEAAVTFLILNLSSRNLTKHVYLYL